LMAGTLRAEATLAAANLVYVVLLGLGGVVFATDRFPEAVQPLLQALPVTALAEGMRAVLADGAAPALAPVAVLALWTAAGAALAARFFRWGCSVCGNLLVAVAGSGIRGPTARPGERRRG